MHSYTRWLMGATVAAAVLATACGGNDDTSTKSSTTATTSAAAAATSATGTSASAAVTSDTKAAQLRSDLNGLLQEHVFLAASATGGALGGRPAQFNGAAAQLDANGVELSKLIGAAYGPGAEQAFLPLWRKHIGFVVDYTQGLGAKDTAKAEKAVADLTAYQQELGAFFASANPNLTKDAVAGLVGGHILSLKAVIDAQAAGDAPKQFAAIRDAAGHMHMIGDPLSAAIAKQFPDKFPGDAGSSAATLRSTLNLGLREHVYLAARATAAALGGREAEYKAAAAALDENSVDVSKLIGSAYGTGAEQAFLPLWRKHIGFFVDYTQGVGAKDTAKQEKAVADLTAYQQELATFFNSANGLPKDTLVGLIKEHILSLKSVVDAQGAGDQAKVYYDLRTAMSHMHMIGDPLAEATVKKFPEKFAK